ncbi:hypothetical protein FBALC1_11052 [Flavobacteriales bacterium ALC-1]|nr:hypothetical protein FBALC1_11052 [Flavobacteriales bacterium ALC-1]
MRKNYKLVLSIVVVLLSGLIAFAQEVEYKDVILDGKPAKLNVATGKITFVNPKDKKKPIKFDDYVVESNKTAKAIKAKNDSAKKKAAIITNSSVIGASNVTEADTLSFHVVKEGETLFDVSKAYNLSLTDLKRINNLETTLINKGQKLRVANFDVQTETIAIEKTNDANKLSTSNFHIVDKNETLYGIAKRYGLSINELKSKNNLNTNLIKVGQKLRVRNFGLSSSVNNIATWTVEKGDTLFSIAKKSGIPLDTIKQLNGLTSNTIMIGQILQLK